MFDEPHITNNGSTLKNISFGFFPLAHLNCIFFQRDGNPVHNSSLIRPALDLHFSDYCMDTRGPIRWPADLPIRLFFNSSKIYFIHFDNLWKHNLLQLVVAVGIVSTAN